MDPRGAQRYKKRRRAAVGAADNVSGSSSGSLRPDGAGSDCPKGIRRWGGLEEEDLMPMPHAVEEEVRKSWEWRKVVKGEEGTRGELKDWGTRCDRRSRHKEVLRTRRNRSKQEQPLRCQV